MTADAVGEPVRVVVVDDHPAFRAGLRALLGTAPIDVVGEASTGEEAITVAEELQPDVVVMDLHMPHTGGIEATREIVRATPHVGVLVLTMLEDDDSVFKALRAGARGYLVKGAGRQELVAAVEAVSRGEAIFGSSIAERIIRYFSGGSPQPANPAFPGLTRREQEVLELLARGYGNAAIAQELYVSPKTVRNHVSNVFAKLHVADRAQAIIMAREAGLGTDA